MADRSNADLLAPAPAGRLRYEVVDVFTDRPFAGNPLAVVYGADALTTEQLHAVAMEFNLSETTFPVALTDDDRAAGADYRVRIFTPAGEIPFAGHPTLGTAWSLKQAGAIGAGRRRQACGAGLIGVELADEPTEAVELSAVPRDHARPLDRRAAVQLAELVGLEPADVVGDAYAAGCGLTWLYLPVTTEAVARSRTGSRRVSETDVDLSLLVDPCDGIDVYALKEPGDSAEPIGVSSRVYVPGFGISEDPATGSAAAGLGLVLVASGVAAGEGSTAYTVSQGVELGRPSVLHGRVEAAGGETTLVHVSGQVVPVATGTIAVPSSS